jgi:hypothetical protein
VNQPISKSSLSTNQSRLIDLLQNNPFCRIECLQVGGGEPLFSPPPRVIQKLKMGAENRPRPESTLPDFWLKRQAIELLETIAELGEGEIRSIEIAHGLPLMVEIERRQIVDGECTHA